MAKSKAIVKMDEETKVEILTAEEVKKIDEAVEFINKQANSTAKSLLAIGLYLLKEFFDGDVKKAEDRAPRKGISLRKIAEHEDIFHSFMTLSNAVRLAAQESLFSDTKYNSLTESHKLLLFRLPDDKTKKSYAEKVINEDLSYRGLQDKLIKAGYIVPRGRKELTEGVKKALKKDPFAKFFTPIEKLVGFDWDFDSVEEFDFTEERLTALRSLKERIEKLLEKADTSEV